MVVNMIFIFVFMLGIIPDYTFAGNQCAIQFPRRGYCINRSSSCPGGSQEYQRLSNGIGCAALNQRCCVTGRQPSSPGGQGPPEMSRNSCGIASFEGELSPKILNGIKAGPCDWPFVVSIRPKLKSSSALDYFSTSHRCGGVLISRSWVLTSASCVINAGGSPINAPNQFIVVAGEYNISGIDIDPRSRQQQEQILNVQRVMIHPKYAYRDSSQVDLNNPQLINGNSVALIKLSKSIEPRRCAGAVCLPTLEEAEDRCSSYKDCVITGWGHVSESFSPPKGALDILKQGHVKLASKKGCDLVASRLGKATTRPEGTICQLPDEYHLTDGCLGDEGGAVMCSTGKNWVVRAILPFQFCKKDKFNLFLTDVSPYVAWIKNTMTMYGN